MLKNNGFHNRHSPILRAFSPLSLFSGGAPGAWYDPSDYSTLFQDSAGTTPVTAVEQPVGLMLDKSQGLVLGPELVTNGDFATDTWWTKGPGCTISGGVGVAISAANGSGFYRLSLLTVGVYYEITFTVVSRTAGAFRVGFFSSAYSPSYSTPGTYTVRLRADSTSFVVETVGVTIGTIDNVSVKAVAGNHAFQSTSASRPVLSARVNKLLATATLATQSVTTRAAAHTLRFEGAGSITLSGTAIGTFAAGSHSVTATAGTLTLTVSGSVTSADLRETNDGVGVPAYQAVVTSTNYATAGFLPYLKFDGVDDSLSTNSINFTSTDKMSVFAGVRKLSDAAQGMVAEIGNDANNAFLLLAPRTNAGLNYGFRSKGTTASDATSSSSYTSPITNTLTGLGDISGDLATLRVNGVQAAQNTGDQGTGNFGNYPLYIGRRAGSSLPFNGQMYSMIIVGKAVTAGELSGTETYVNQKTGAY